VFGSLGAPELIAILVLALLLFGPKKLPELGRALGRSFAEFRRATTELKSTLEREIADADRPTVIPQPPGESVARSPAELVSSNGKTVGTEPD
jgi:sec-independent protein translocase protein TatA